MSDFREFPDMPQLLCNRAKSRGAHLTGLPAIIRAMKNNLCGGERHGA